MKTIEDAIGDLPGLRRAIEASRFDAVIAMSPENIRYVSDAPIATHNVIRDRLGLIVWPSGGDPVYVLCQVEEGFMREESWIQDLRPYKEFIDSPMTLVADVLRELGLTNGLVGAETDYLGAMYHAQLMQEVPGLQIEACTDLFAHVRMLKTPREREILVGGFQGTEKALLATYSTVNAGESEQSMGRRLADAMLRSGADAIAFNHINAGPNTGYPHMHPSTYRVKKGDLIKADCGAYYREYLSNVGRTAKMGPTTDEERSWWKRLREIHWEIIDMLRPGNSGRQLFERTTELHRQAGIPFPFGHNGHGIGLQVHEHPLISPHEDLVYQVGMLSTVETRVRWVGEYGLHMEDLVEITEGSPIVRTGFFDNEEILVV